HSATTATPYPVLHLRSRREFTVLNGHPWVFSGAFRDLARDGHDIPPGAVVDLISSRGEWVARGHLNARNSLAFRLLTLDRDDIRVREREGLTAGGATVEAGDVPETVEIAEYGVRYLVDPWHGQKTGFFLDQRDKRATIGQLATHAHTLLNAFSYSGGFALAALAHNPTLRTTNVDASAAALDLARRNYQLNGQDPDAHEFVD